MRARLMTSPPNTGDRGALPGRCSCAPMKSLQNTGDRGALPRRCSCAPMKSLHSTGDGRVRPRRCLRTAGSAGRCLGSWSCAVLARVGCVAHMYHRGVSGSAASCVRCMPTCLSAELVRLSCMHVCWYVLGFGRAGADIPSSFLCSPASRQQCLQRHEHVQESWATSACAFLFWHTGPYTL